MSENKDGNGGLRREDLENIIFILKKENGIESAYLFGSRAKGVYKNGSDVDIALKGKQIDHNLINHISYLLNEETPMPYRFDVINYNKIKNTELISHIDRNGQLIFTRK
ncbi:MAG: nucleotidyltransferase domain-containing protein [Ignavibacteria bacterium]|nr:nucleotidyltransferase domain-containing protein [Ignavibacteria bacterium]